MEKVLVPKKRTKTFQVSKQDGKSFSSKKKELKLFRFQNKTEKVLVPKKRTKTFQVSKQDGKKF